MMYRLHNTYKLEDTEIMPKIYIGLNIDLQEN